MGPGEVLDVLRELPLADLRALLPQVQQVFAQRLGTEGTVSVKSRHGEQRGGQGGGVEGGTVREQEQHVFPERQDPLRKLPPLLLEQMWPEARVALGLQACTWLRHVLQSRMSFLWRLPAVLLNRVWPAERAVMGMMVCKWLRRRLQCSPPKTVVLQGYKGPWNANSFHVFQSFRQFRKSVVHLRWTDIGPKPRNGESDDDDVEEYDEGGLSRNWDALCEGMKFSRHVNRKIQSVDVGRNKLLRWHADALIFALSCFKALTHLNLSHLMDEFDETFLRSLSELPRFCPALAHLNLSGNVLQPSDKRDYFRSFAADHLATLLRQTHRLQRLELAQCSLDLIFGRRELVGVLGAISSLCHLDLSKNKGEESFRPGYADSLPDILTGCTGLTFLDLSENGLRRCQREFTVLNDFTNLQTLKLGGNCFIGLSNRVACQWLHLEAQVKLPEFGRFKALTALDMPDTNGLNDSQMSALADSLGECKDLRRLNLSQGAFGDGGLHWQDSTLQSLVNVLATSCTRLASLDLSSSDLSPATAPTLATSLIETLLHCECLARLYLRECNLGSEGAALAVALPRWRKLSVLDIAGNRLADVGATHVAQVLQHCSTLQVLGLRNNGIGDDGGEKLLHAFGRWAEAVQTSMEPLFDSVDCGPRTAFVDLRQNEIVASQPWEGLALGWEDSTTTDMHSLHSRLIDNGFCVHVRLYDGPGYLEWQSADILVCDRLLQSN